MLPEALLMPVALVLALLMQDIFLLLGEPLNCLFRYQHLTKYWIHLLFLSADNYNFASYSFHRKVFVSVSKVGGDSAQHAQQASW